MKKLTHILSFFLLLFGFSTLNVNATCIVNDDNTTSCFVAKDEPAILCPDEYSPVCGQPPMPPCPEGVDCIQAFPPLETYPNRCEMNKAGAEFVKEGKCDIECPVYDMPNPPAGCSYTDSGEKDENGCPKAPKLVCPELGCSSEYKPVCGQPPMPPCPEGRYCKQVMPQPITYDNECKMREARANLIKEGECLVGCPLYDIEPAPAGCSYVDSGEKDENGCPKYPELVCEKQEEEIIIEPKELKDKLDQMLDGLFERIGSKYSDDLEKQIKIYENMIYRLEILSSKIEKFSNLLDYMILNISKKLEELKFTQEDLLNELEEIFNEQ